MEKAIKVAEMSETKRKLLDAGVDLMRRQGYSATTVDDVCAAAGVTKGSFFHYFKTKEEIAKAALVRFGDGNTNQYRAADFRKLEDPLARVFGRLDFAIEAAGGVEKLTKGCLIGMLAQEVSFTNPELRGACQELFARTIGDFEKDLLAAKKNRVLTTPFDAKNVATFYVSMLQGSLILAKAAQGNAILKENLLQFRRYLESLFELTPGSSQGTLKQVLEQSRN